MLVVFIFLLNFSVFAEINTTNISSLDFNNLQFTLSKNKIKKLPTNKNLIPKKVIQQPTKIQYIPTYIPVKIPVYYPIYIPRYIPIKNF